MTTYFDHTDRAGLDQRLAVLNCKEARARYLAALAEYEANDITLYMSKHDIMSRRLDGSIMCTAWLCPEVLEPFPLARNFPDPREPRNEREAARAGFSCA